MISALFFILFFLLAHTHRTAVFSEIFSRYFFRKPFKLFSERQQHQRVNHAEQRVHNRNLKRVDCFIHKIELQECVQRVENDRADNCSDYIKVQMNKRCSSCVFGCSDRSNHCGYACADMLTHDYRYRTAECDRTGCGKSLQNAYRGGRALNYCRQNAADNYRKNRIFSENYE